MWCTRSFPMEGTILYDAPPEDDPDLVAEFEAGEEGVFDDCELVTKTIKRYGVAFAKDRTFILLNPGEMLMRHAHSVKNDFSDVNVMDAHGGQEKDNKVDKHIALDQAAEGFARLASGRVQLVAPMTFREVAAGEKLFPDLGDASPVLPACVEITSVVRHARSGRPGASFDTAQINGLMDAVKHGKREFLGVRHERVALTGSSRLEVFKVYVTH